ncbi:MAG: ARMT1-like domain-containing protein [archaeon]
MKYQEECWDCAYNQIKRAAKHGIKDEEKRKKVIEKANKIAEKSVPVDTPAEFGTKIHAYINENSDTYPFEEFRVKGLEAAEKALEILKPEIKTLKDACVAAIIGNYIDSTPMGDDMGKLDEFRNMIHEELAVDDFEKFEKLLESAKTVVYLTDNYGEHLFDLEVVRMLSELEKDVTCVGKAGKILNDATAQDLKDAGFEKYAKVESLGAACIGVVWEAVSEDFKKLFEEGDLIIAKGMGNYESLEDNPREIVFMLRAKCWPVARNLGVQKGDNVLKVKEKKD